MIIAIDNGLWRFANAELDPQARVLKVNGQPVAIEPKPFDVLLLLLQNAGELLTLDELLDTAWTGRVVNEATITNTIFKIRKALGDENQFIIKTIPKAGYRLVCPVERLVGVTGPASRPELSEGSDVPGREQWQLSRRLGSGGYGDAWLVRQKKTGETRVFKFCTEADRLPAFKREVTLYRLLRQALPDHDCFARIMEWNFEQPPYFIESDYAGDNLRLWVESRGGLAAIPLDERIGLIAEIAAAVAAAHSVGVLHKDLKPENILVDDRNGKRTVRLCDFGVGRLIDAEKLASLGITRLGFTQTVATDPSTSGTLIYMAPELLSSGMPSVQSDIYALGVLLYQVVAGHFGEPMAHGWEASIPDELLRQDIADAAHGDRSKRIGSAQILADRLIDLARRREQLSHRRHEQQQAAQAQRELERSRVRRPWIVAAILILVIGLVSSLYMASRARSQARLAESLTAFVSDDVLNGSDAFSTAAPEVMLRSAILKALPLVDKRFAGEPEAAASMDTTLAQALRRMTDGSDALAMDHKAADLYRQTYGNNDVRTLISQAYMAADLWSLGRIVEAAALLESIFPQLQSMLPPADPRLFYTRLLEANMVCKQRTSCPESLAQYAQLIADMQSVRGDDSLLIRVELAYSGELFQSGRLADAERLVRQWLPEVRQKFGDDGYQTMQFRGRLGRVLLEEHHFPEAEVEFRARLESLNKLGDPEDRHVIDCMQALADAYSAQDKWSQSLDLRMQSYSLAEKHFGENAAMTSTGSDIAEALDGLGRYQEALSWAQKTLAANKQTPSPDPLSDMQGLFMETRSLIHLNRLPEAHKAMDELVPIMRGQFSGDVDVEPQLLYMQAELAKAERNFSAAHDLLTRAIAIDEKTWGADDPTTRQARKLLQSIPMT